MTDTENPKSITADAPAKRIRPVGFIVGYFKKRPATLALSLLILVIGILGLVFQVPDAAMNKLGGTGYEPIAIQGRWWSAITALFVTVNAAELVAAFLLVVLLVGVSSLLWACGAPCSPGLLPPSSAFLSVWGCSRLA